MGKEYKAFISYRHLPADSRIAERVHRGVEHYRIPRQLAGDGKRRFGRVFRDKEELPLSVNLTDSIHEALDHTEYLIVICSPETPKSQWVREEIRYFLKAHDLDHVMAVLVEGEPGEAYPPELLHRYAPDGTVLEDVEPIAADVRGSSRREVERKISREFLRIYARLLGCDFDDLYRREQRYRTRRALTAAVATALVSALFIGMLLNRNAQIREQMLAAQRSESQALVELSRSAYRSGAYRDALSMALRALPGPGRERPYVPEAEMLLGDEIALYRYDSLEIVQSVDCRTQVAACAVSPETMLLLTLGSDGSLAAYDIRTGQLRWQAQELKNVFSIRLREDLGLVLAREGERLAAVELESGALLWELPGFPLLSKPESGEECLCSNSGFVGGILQQTLFFLDLRSGEKKDEYPISADLIDALAVSPDGRYGAVVAENWEGVRVLLLDREKGELIPLEGDYPKGGLSHAYELCFSESGNLILASAASFSAVGEGERAGFVACFRGDAAWAKSFETDLNLNTETVVVNGGYSFLPELQLIACTDKGILAAGKKEVIRLDEENGSVLWERHFDLTIRAMQGYPGKGLGLVLSNGTLTFCSDSGFLGMDMGTLSLESGIETDLAAIGGESFNGSVFALIPGGEQRRVILLANLGEPALPVLMGPEQLFGGPTILTSPSGEWIGCLGSNNAADALNGTVLRGGEESWSFTLPEGSLGSKDRAFMTDSGLVLTDQYVIDPQSGSCRGLTRTGELPKSSSAARAASFIRSRDGAVLTGSVELDGKDAYLLLWENGQLQKTVTIPEIPEELEGGTPGCIACGGAGNALVRLFSVGNEPDNYRLYYGKEERWLEPERFCTGETAAWALAEERDWLAAAETEGGLRIYDLAGERLLRQLPYPLSVGSIAKLLFAQGDQILLVFGQEGDLSVFNTETGELLQQIYCGDRIPRFDGDAHYRLYPIEGQNRRLLIYANESFLVPFGLILHGESWEAAGVYTGVADYLPGTGELLLHRENSALYRCPLLSAEEIVAAGEEKLKDNGLWK